MNLGLFFESGESTLTVRRFAVHEAMSEPFEVAVIARAPSDDIDLGSIVGKQAGFWLETGVVGESSPRRVWSGICRHMELLQVEPDGLASYFLRIVPVMWLLGQRVGCRIFQHLSVPEIVTKVLAEWNVKPDRRLGLEHPKLEYVVQWRETDLAFVSRLLEREAISYSFAFHEDRPTELVLSDQPEQATARGSVAFHDNPNEVHAAERVENVRMVHAVRPGRVTLRDFDFRRKLDYQLFGRSGPVAGSESFFEQYHYRPGAFLAEGGPGGGETPVGDDQGVARHDEKRGQLLAERTLASVRRGKRQVIFDTTVLGLAPGVVVSIDGHPHPALAASNKLLMTAFSVEGTSDGEWTFSGEAQFAADPFAPERRTPSPRIAGVQVATVVGPKGEEIYCDELGRVRVQFPWDRDGKLTERSSCWLRVSQAWAGTGFGCIALPRVGHEVLVGFYEGDPDQPVIVGRAHNAAQPLAYPLPAHKTKSTFKSHSSPQADGHNEVRIEDRRGKELVYLQAQRNLQKLVRNDETERTGKSRLVVVGGSRHAVIGKADATMVGERWSLQMVEPPKDADLALMQQAEPKVTPLATKVEMVDERLMGTTGPAQLLLHKKHVLLQCKGGLSIKAGGQVIVQGGPNVRIN